MSGRLVLGTRCSDCDREMVPASLWRRLPASAREALRQTHARRHARGLCTTCTSRHIRAGTLIDRELVRLTHEDIMDEYVVLSRLGEGFTDQQIADRLGIHLETLRRHLARETA